MKKVMNALAYTGILFFLPLVVNKDEVGKFHANQGLIALIVSVILHVVGGILGALTGIPLVGFIVGIVGTIFGWGAWLVNVGMLIFGIVNAINDTTNPLPIVGKIAILK